MKARIVAWRVLACVKLGRALPQLPASVLYSSEELEVLEAAVKKTPTPNPLPSLPWEKPTGWSPDWGATWQEKETASQGPRVSALGCED